MLPILRLIPVGGVFLAIAILLLALNPPQATSRSTRASLQPARGALIDRGEHPEWRQFLIQAALRRADEVERLRSLRDTVVRSEPPVAMMPAPAWIEAKPDVVEPPSAEAKPGIAKAPSAKAEPEIAEAAPVEVEQNDTEAKAAAPKAVMAEPETAEPKIADLTPIIDAAPTPAETEAATSEPKPVAAEPKIADAAPEPEAAELKVADLSLIVDPEPKAAAPKPTEPQSGASEPEPVAAAPEIAEAAPAGPESETSKLKVADLSLIIDPEPKAAAPKPTESQSVASETDPVAAEPEIADAAPASPLETNGVRVRPDAAPPIAPSPAETRIAALPAAKVEEDSDDITGSIEPAEHTATMPIGIGEASSTELEVTLPRERPPVLKRLDLRRGRESKVKQPRRRVHHVSRARKKRTRRESFPPAFNIFAALFKAFNPDAKFDPNAEFVPIKPTIPYVPNNSWKRQ